MQGCFSSPGIMPVLSELMVFLRSVCLLTTRALVAVGTESAGMMSRAHAY
jgi:hypothetical protein